MSLNKLARPPISIAKKVRRAFATDQLRPILLKCLRLTTKVRTGDFDYGELREIYKILEDTTERECLFGTKDWYPHRYGRTQQIERISKVADYCAKKYGGDFIEIGSYLGETTKQLAEQARKHSRRVIAVDPWEAGTQNCEGWEYDQFMANMKPYMDILDIVRASSLDQRTINLIKSRKLCFAFVDGLHTYSACLSDILTVSHTLGIIAVDDILWDNNIMLAFRRGAHITSRIPIHHKLCREGYLIPQQKRGSR